MNVRLLIERMDFMMNAGGDTLYHCGVTLEFVSILCPFVQLLIKGSYVCMEV